MRIAKDGKPFDVDNLDDEITEEEVELIQFLRPDGKRRRMVATVGKDVARMAADMVLSCEELRTGEVAIYTRFADEPDKQERLELATNGPGPKEPSKVLVKRIKTKFVERIQPRE